MEEVTEEEVEGLVQLHPRDHSPVTLPLNLTASSTQLLNLPFANTDSPAYSVTGEVTEQEIANLELSEAIVQRRVVLAQENADAWSQQAQDNWNAAVDPSSPTLGSDEDPPTRSNTRESSPIPSTDPPLDPTTSVPIVFVPRNLEESSNEFRRRALNYTFPFEPHHHYYFTLREALDPTIIKHPVLHSTYHHHIVYIEWTQDCSCFNEDHRKVHWTAHCIDHLPGREDQRIIIDQILARESKITVGISQYSPWSEIAHVWFTKREPIKRLQPLPFHQLIR